MKKVFILFLAAFVALPSFTARAQIIEDFETNTLNWQEFASGNREAVVKDGVLHMKSSLGDRFVYATCLAPIDFSEPFRVKATIVDTKLDSDSKGVAVVFNYSDDYNLDAFFISKETVAFFEQSRNERVRYREADFKFNKKLKEHELVLEYRNRKVSLIIDDVQCLEIPYINMEYNGFGFAVFGISQEVSIDQVEFRQM